MWLWVCVAVCICMTVCICVAACICYTVCMCLCSSMTDCIFTCVLCVYFFINTLVCVCLWACLCVCLCVSVYLYVCVSMCPLPFPYKHSKTWFNMFCNQLYRQIYRKHKPTKAAITKQSIERHRSQFLVQNKLHSWCDHAENICYLISQLVVALDSFELLGHSD